MGVYASPTLVPHRMRRAASYHVGSPSYHSPPTSSSDTMTPPINLPDRPGSMQVYGAPRVYGEAGYAYGRQLDPMSPHLGRNRAQSMPALPGGFERQLSGSRVTSPQS
jgi:hypothetical protein